MFADFLQRHSGIVLGDNKQYLVRSRLSPVLRQHQYPNLGELIRAVLGVGNLSLRNQVIEAMTTNETLWFRDGAPFELFKQQLLPQFADRNGGRLRIWSAACSTGQEPYSLAMSVQEYRQANLGKLLQQPEILATDIDTNVLATAMVGKYDQLAMGRGLSPLRQQQFFNRDHDGRSQIAELIRTMVTFRRYNLLDSYLLLGKFDIIFCRNVLIYFSIDDKRKVLRQFAAALNPGGYLMLGASESMVLLSEEFEMVRSELGIVYRRR
nr:protein-glutamate O-methyltransferase CheR [Ferrimonas senticii]